ncbi:hypothetical protein P168DRAFT_60524 [Aspergillus campestris IBT 28561]|uniref:Uncharacterized protein n=1 Tax=Aspergillus campestris (strain IBT 28561) TaxID=1392248 RepID=A0A2I1CUD9_ASPC2|nr:uncharacterized protein P168DRAFT_60524 [Aspergillus campestris IBT 28561]PKY01231.1 hypothetical protein P168DRAFT_60524 [Aspergillus campestris IBT 28561]
MSTYEDPKMKQLYDDSSEFAALDQTGAAAVIDFFPWISKLPGFLVHAQKHAKALHRREKALYLSHWLHALRDIARRSIRLCFCVAGCLTPRRRKPSATTRRSSTWTATSGTIRIRATPLLTWMRCSATSTRSVLIVASVGAFLSRSAVCFWGCRRGGMLIRQSMVQDPLC